MNSRDGMSGVRTGRGIRGLSAFALIILAGGAAFCRFYNLERNLNPEHGDFLSKVRYIITGEERKAFLRVPDPRKDEFIKEFWEKRNPLPGSGKNEYKKEYEARVKRSEGLFRGEGRPGWLTDRGRILILFGPPQERLTYPMDMAGYCREVWYYGNFPVLFVDEHCTGQFRLTAINLAHLQEINIAQGHFQKSIKDRVVSLDFEIEIRKVRSEDLLHESVVALGIPYNEIWFSFNESRLVAAFDVRMSLETEAGEVAWNSGKTFEVTLAAADLKALEGDKYWMEMSVVLEGRLEEFRAQELTLLISVRDPKKGGEYRKAVEFRLESEPQFEIDCP
jgi:GWxTD domain-containing protein